MHDTLFAIGPITIKSYGTMIAIGFLAALMLSVRRAPKYKLDKEEVWNLWFICLGGGLLGAKLLFLLVELPKLTSAKLSWATIAEGFVVYGGIIGGAMGIYLYCRYKKLEAWKYLDLVAPSVAVGQGFGRIGCFLAGCCYGKETDSALGVVFRNSLFAPNDVSVYPTQLFSAIGDFALVFILLYAAGKKHKDGVILSLYLILYGVGRFLLEFLRADARGAVGILSTSQFISIFIVLGGAFIWWKSNKRQDNYII